MVPKDGGKYYLGGDIVLGATQHITAGAAVTLCLNGHILNLQVQEPLYGIMEGSVICIDEKAVLNLCDCNSTGKTRYGYWTDGAELYNRVYTIQPEVPSEDEHDILTGGIITGGTGEADLVNESASGQGGGIYIDSYGSLNMTGGTVTGNYSAAGGDVKIFDAGVQISGGSFCSNLAEYTPESVLALQQFSS